eukprot:TRINITY_DN16324_c0_g1_i3.p1 TRINITY_DN16324_c0_g1~~TRINITY_DN16324_c0_g1_i3.p1  ORF type:complete len:739 (-),score=133.82 TRINITY_DN16324_c0_g1_i3:291-2507(-)
MDAVHATALTVDDLLKRDKQRKTVNQEALRADERTINCLRSLAMDAVQQANSGHPGTPMAMAPVGYALWARVLIYDPEEPNWLNRDRFVLSMGHASMHLYGLLHLAGVREVDPETGKALPSGELAVSLDDIKAFRQIGGKCPGHPEYGETTGVEMTTGPLGQGVASSVGMAIGSKWLGATFNRPGFEMFDYDVYAMCGDGCLQEGVSSEAASLAGHLKLDNLCWIWDNNHITIEGNTAWAISEEVATRFISYGWNVNRVGDANDVEALTRAFLAFKKEKERPTLIIVDSHIAWGSPTKQDHFSAHGSPLGEQEVSATKALYGWPDEKFLVPEELTRHFRQQMLARGGAKRKEWDNLLVKYEREHPRESRTLRHILEGTLPEGWDSHLQAFAADAKGKATRVSSGECLNMVAKAVPWMLGGSADLAPSCNTTLKFPQAGDFMPPSSGWGSYAGRNFHFGIREHAMGSIMNGMALCGLRPFGSTFFVFSDYMKPPIRMSAIMRVPSIWIFTHDSVSVGEDGPTHQPIEQLSALRSIPELLVFRPCDANETLEMWKHILPLKDEPAAVVLTRQNVPTLDRSKFASAEGLHKGAYVIAGDADATPEVILLASGSEVHLMLEAHGELAAQGVKVRSISIPCFGRFKQQPDEYIAKLLPDVCRARVSVEAGRRDQWSALVGLDGEHIGMASFGESGPGDKVLQKRGLTAENIVKAARRSMAGKSNSLESRGSHGRAPKRRKVCA